MYVDSDIFLNVIKKEKGLWPNSYKVLRAAYRGDIQIVASTLLLVELNGRKGDVDASERDRIVEEYLERLEIQWVEVDLLVAREVRQLADKYKLRGPDATHLATAVRTKADYFFSRDKAFPYGTTVGITHVTNPREVWDPTTDDAEIDVQAAAEVGPA
ncbi:type II toxin-antitoxin system VapC family toxin [Streptomyces sp. NWU49]|uniref:type II toxin-antitoxin system VapC family toxin n=1 Tax=Streptomyces sp. NWU49 TaxID=2201153 RepID=UPI00215B26B9|nr:type II toxin-antitoxin system VapC family toxin [Streptomyces sp. NWU49]